MRSYPYASPPLMMRHSPMSVPSPEKSNGSDHRGDLGSAIFPAATFPPASFSFPEQRGLRQRRIPAWFGRAERPGPGPPPDCARRPAHAYKPTQARTVTARNPSPQLRGTSGHFRPANAPSTAFSKHVGQIVLCFGQSCPAARRYQRMAFSGSGNRAQSELVGPANFVLCPGMPLRGGFGEPLERLCEVLCARATLFRTTIRENTVPWRTLWPPRARTSAWRHP